MNQSRWPDAITVKFGFVFNNLQTGSSYLIAPNNIGSEFSFNINIHQLIGYTIKLW